MKQYNSWKNNISVLDSIDQFYNFMHHQTVFYRSNVNKLMDIEY